MPILSIIIPVYKTEKYLAECVDSILNQTYHDLEIILVDDGSPDSSPALCDQYAAMDARVRVLHKENGGVSTARNAGLDIASGNYIAFVDSDDWLDANMYADMIAKACEFDCDVVMCDCLKEHPMQSVLYSHDIRGGFYSREALEKEYFHHLLMMENVEYPATISNCLLLFRRELADDLRYLTGVRYSEDLLFGAQLLYRAKSFFYLRGQAYYHYRMNTDSATHKFVTDKWNDYKRLHQGIQDSFKDCQTFDFTRQIDLCLLFFVYNSVGDFLGAKQLPRAVRLEKIQSILCDYAVRGMFSRLQIRSLPILLKQKLITWLYKKQSALDLLCRYYERK